MRALNPFEVTFSGINLVEASAGTGKTYNITSLYVRALIELDISVSKILVVTYTEAATKELKERLLKRLRQSISVLKAEDVEDKNDKFLFDLLTNVKDRSKAVEQLEQALRTFDEAAIYTIHGFCYQALQEQAFESRAAYDAEMIGDDSELVLEAVDDFWRNWVAEASDDKLKRPLLKFLVDNNYTPDSLAQELGGYLGQPFLEIHPRQTRTTGQIMECVKDLYAIYEQMQEKWDRQQISSLLQSDDLNGNKYRSSSVEKWTRKMEDFLNPDVPSIDLFDKFEKFTQSTINNSLNNGATGGLEHPFFLCTERYQQVAENLQNYDVAFKKKLLLDLRATLRKKKDDLQLLSFDDLLLRLRESLMNHRRGQQLADKLRKKYPLALVDEFQDTDPSQYDIFRRIYKSESDSALFMIGDPKQSIYSFRGADVFSYLKAKQDAPDENTFELDRNFRSTPKLISGINTLFENHANPFIIDRITFEGVKPGRPEGSYNLLSEEGEIPPPIRLRQFPDHTDQLNKTEAAEIAARDTATEISRLIEGGKKGQIKIGTDTVKAQDIAVLVRKHQEAALMSEALEERGIKSVRYSQESVFQREEAYQLEVFLKAVAEPANESLIKTALALPLTEFTAAQLLEVEEDEEQWIKILDLFAVWHRKWRKEGFSAMFRSVLKEMEVAQQLIQHHNGERRLTNLLHLGELLQQEGQHHKEGMRGLLKWLAHKRQDSGSLQDEELLRLESDQELVKIVTMHSSKGLEYPIVFCPFLWHGPRYQDRGQPLVYHDPMDLDKVNLDLNGKTDPDRNRKRLLKAKEELAESLRLAYVAMTRAEKCIYLTWIYAKKSEFSPLGYLLQGSEAVFDQLEQTIKSSYTSVGNAKFDRALQCLCESHPHLYTMEKKPVKAETHRLEFPNFDEMSSLGCRRFKRSLPLGTSYQLSSFSALTSWMEEDDPHMPDYDQFLVSPAQEPEQTERTMFTFPKGPQPGTCIHKIFEDIDFADPGDADTVINESLELYGIDTAWNPTVHRMLETVLHASLLPAAEGLKLSALKKNDVIAEMEFYYQNENLETERLLSIIRDNGATIPGLGGKAEAGFLKGFIDLTFSYGGKYYILDYKTNYLGDSFADYEQDKLQEEMREASYDLQYHLYSIALHRFLKHKLPSYSYEEHFGGAFYLFLRGMNTEGREGIFFDRPDFSIIRQLNRYIRGGGNE